MYFTIVFVMVFPSSLLDNASRLSACLTRDGNRRQASKTIMARRSSTVVFVPWADAELSKSIADFFSCGGFDNG